MMAIPRIDLIGQNGNTGEHYDRDPTGLDPHDPGSKLDAGKVRPGLVIGGFARALLAVSDVGTFGANKYSDNGWKSVDGGLQRYTDAMFRHYLDEACGTRVDEDSGCLHAAQVAWNALARLEFILQEIEDEDRSDREQDTVEEYVARPLDRRSNCDGVGEGESKPCCRR
jgi:hypothetical protein